MFADRQKSKDASRRIVTRISQERVTTTFSYDEVRRHDVGHRIGCASPTDLTLLRQDARPCQLQRHRLIKSSNQGFFAEMQSIQPGLRLQSKTPLSLTNVYFGQHCVAA